MSVKKESDLYLPVRRFLEHRGYRVRGEVVDCDLAAVRGQELVVVELKRTFNLTLVFQGIDRQRITDQVFVAVENPRSRKRARWRDVHGLCRKLSLGLMTVTVGARRSSVSVELEPGPYRPRKNKSRRDSLLQEMQMRSADFNLGGSSLRPIVTAYREEALRVAYRLNLEGASKVAVVRESAPSPRAGSILLNNVYGWFERVDRGVYCLTQEGEKAIEHYADVVQVITQSTFDTGPEMNRKAS